MQNCNFTTMHRILILSVLVAFSGCSTGKHFTQVDLYFGQFKLDGTTVTEQEWNSFVENYVSRVFREGSTITRASGNWYDTAQRKIIVEPTYKVVSINRMTPVLSRQIDSVRYWYKKLYNQQSVLRVDNKVKAKLLD
jgi:hypothetical protein